MRSVVALLCVMAVVACVFLWGQSMTAWAQAETGNAKKTNAAETGAPKQIPVIQVVWPGGTAKALFWRTVRLAKCALWTLVLCHVLLAGWVFFDNRKRAGNHGMFALLALLAGFPAAVVYALVRIGDKKA
jgi:hypothetical protein